VKIRQSYYQNIITYQNKLSRFMHHVQKKHSVYS